MRRVEHGRCPEGLPFMRRGHDGRQQLVLVARQLVDLALLCLDEGLEFVQTGFQLPPISSPQSGLLPRKVGALDL